MSLASSSQRPSLRGQFIDADFDFASLGAALWRARYTILRPTILVALITFAVVIMIPPKYQSEARVLIVGRDNVFPSPRRRQGRHRPRHHRSGHGDQPGAADHVARGCQ